MIGFTRACAVLLARLAVAVALAAWPAHAALAQSPSAPRATPVEASQASVEPIVETLHAVGTLRANQSVIVRPEIAGVITTIHFDESTAVGKGQLLFSLDDSILRAELAQAEASLRLSERNAERANELFDRQAGTGRAVDEARSSLESNRASVALARARLEKTKIAAPFEGMTGLHQLDPGEYVTPGQDLVSLDDTDPVEIDFDVPERFLRFLAVDQELRVRVDALPGRTFEGRVFAISPRADPGGRSLAVRARVPNPEGALKPGLFAEVNVLVEHRQSAVVIPEQAILPRGDSQFVFLVVDGKAKLTPVEIGMRAYGRVEIVGGIAPGDMVVTAGQMKIRDGIPIRILEPQKSAGG